MLIHRDKNGIRFGRMLYWVLEYIFGGWCAGDFPPDLTPVSFCVLIFVFGCPWMCLLASVFALAGNSGVETYSTATVVTTVETPETGAEFQVCHNK